MRGVALILYYTKLLKNNQKLFNYLVLPQIHPPPKGRGFLCALWVNLPSSKSYPQPPLCIFNCPLEQYNGDFGVFYLVRQNDLPARELVGIRD